jgi:hypothetical protein
MRQFEIWVEEHVSRIIPTEWFDGDIRTWFKYSPLGYDPVQLYDEFEAEVDEVIEFAAQKVASESVLSYTKDMYGILKFESEEDRKEKWFELAVFLCASRQHKE